MRGVIVPFYYDGSYQSERYRLLMDFFKVQAARWAHAFDRLYLVDSGWRMTDGDRATLDALFASTCYVECGPRPHWTNVRAAVELAARDGVEVVMLMDSDTIIYNDTRITNELKRIEGGLCDIMAITDGSGGCRIADEFLQFAANEWRAERRRLAPYLLLAHREYLDGLNFAPSSPGKSDWMDSFGKATLDIMRRGANLEELEDDRCSLYLTRDGSITASTNLDGPPYLWSVPIDKKKRLGYHHIRNFGASIRWLDEYYLDREAFDREVKATPPTEFYRLLGWAWMLAEICYPADAPVFGEIEAVVSDTGIPVNRWYAYVNKWPEYHEWLRDLWTA